MAAIQAGSGKLWNAHAYMSHAVACAGGLAVMHEIEEHDLLSRDCTGINIFLDLV
jgi:adenosylmethionine-8-amino-7-oxononanoate aminotransferase